MKNNNYAVSAVISGILSVAIVLAVTTSVFMWGLPHIEETKDKASVENLYNQFSVASDSIQDMVQREVGTSRQYKVDVEQGSISIDSVGDRFVVSYSLDPSYNFTVDGLDDNDFEFNVTFEKDSSYAVSGVAYWFGFPDSSQTGTITDGGVVNYTSVTFDWEESGGDELYSYRLDNYTRLWSQWSSDTSKAYFNLPDGNYTFDVKSDDSSYQNSTSFAVIEDYIDVQRVVANPLGGKKYEFGFTKDTLTDTIRIDLYNASYLFGRILLFDLGLVEYTLSSMSGEYKHIWENNGVLSYSPGKEYVRKAPIFSFGDIDHEIDWWPMFHHDRANTGSSTSTAPETNDTLWVNTLSGEISSSPAVVDGYGYVGSNENNGDLYCFYAEDGTLNWKFDVIGAIQSSPAVVDSKVYFGSFSGGSSEVYCLNASDKIELWNFSVASGVTSSPAVSDGRVYIGSNDGNLHCLDASGIGGGATTQHWFSSVGNGWVSSPAIYGGNVYVATADGALGRIVIRCVSSQTGVMIWSKNLSIQNDLTRISSPTVVNGKVYATSHNATSSEGMIYCLDATGADGTTTVIWENTTGTDDYIESSPAVANGKVYVGSDDHKLYCFDASTGEQMWSFSTGDSVISSPAVADDLVYVGSDDGKVYCLNALNGDEIWNYTTGDPVKSSPAVADGKVYVGSNDGKVYCFGEAQASNILAFRIMQIRNAGSVTSGNGNFRLNVALEENYVREMLTDVYNVKMQVFGPNSDIWFTYFQNYNFVPLNENTLELDMSVPVLLLITQSLCDISLLV